MDGSGDLHTKWSKTNTIWNGLYEESKKNYTNEFIYITEQLIELENEFTVTSGEGWGEG